MSYEVKINNNKLNIALSGNIPENIVLKHISSALSKILFFPEDIVSYRLKRIKDDILINYGAPSENSASDIESLTFELENILSESEQFLEYLSQKLSAADFSDSDIETWINELFANQSKPDCVLTADTDICSLKWLEFSFDDKSRNTYYAKYFNASEENAPLIVSLPGYNAEWNNISYLYTGKYDVLQISPLGYNTPNGYNDALRVRGTWPVLYDTITQLDDKKTYYQWIADCITAIEYIRKPQQPIIFVGTSQGGGTSLVMSSRL